LCWGGRRRGFVLIWGGVAGVFFILYSSTDHSLRPIFSEAFLPRVVRFILYVPVLPQAALRHLFDSTMSSPLRTTLPIRGFPRKGNERKRKFHDGSSLHPAPRCGFPRSSLGQSHPMSRPILVPVQSSHIAGSRYTPPVPGSLLAGLKAVCGRFPHDDASWVNVHDYAGGVLMLPYLWSDQLHSSRRDRKSSVTRIRRVRTVVGTGVGAGYGGDSCARYYLR